MSNLSVSILGCGWFGYPLAIELRDKDFNVKGSTTTTSKLQILKNNGIEPFLIDLDGEPELQTFLKSDVIIINVPPGRHTQKTAGYLAKMNKVAEALNDQHIIFISSTSVYPANNSTVTEELNLAPESESGKVLLEAEQLFKNDFSTILRFAGLFGPDRLPGRFLAGKENVKNPDAPVNLVHLYDCIAAVHTIIRNKLWGKTYNICSDNHPTRKEYYTQAAENLGMVAPNFSDLNESWKIISNDKFKHDAGFQYKINI